MMVKHCRLESSQAIPVPIQAPHWNIFCKINGWHGPRVGVGGRTAGAPFPKSATPAKLSTLSALPLLGGTLLSVPNSLEGTLSALELAKCAALLTSVIFAHVLVLLCLSSGSTRPMLFSQSLSIGVGVCDSDVR